MWLLFILVRIVCLMIESLSITDCHVSTAIVLVFVRRYCQMITCCSKLARCYWCISIFTIFPSSRCPSIIGRHGDWLAVVRFDCRLPCFRNFDSPIYFDIIMMKGYVDCHPLRCTSESLDQFQFFDFKFGLVPERNRCGLIVCLYVFLLLFSEPN